MQTLAHEVAHEIDAGHKRAQLAELRALVAEKFPVVQPSIHGRLDTGCAALDQQGGLRRGAITEVCGSAAGSQLLLASLLDTAERDGFFVGLIDGTNSFEPADWTGGQLARILWVMAGGVTLALKATDLLLRDGNLPMLFLDLRIVPMRELRKIPISTWHRFHRVIENSSTALVVFTPRPMIESAPTRIAITQSFPLSALREERSKLIAQLNLRVYERAMITRDDFRLIQQQAG
jgi:hypothetical protein